MDDGRKLYQGIMETSVRVRYHTIPSYLERYDTILSTYLCGRKISYALDQVEL